MPITTTSAITFAVLTVSKEYGLNTKEFSEMLETLKCINPEQKSKILLYSAAWAAKDIMENKQKGA